MQRIPVKENTLGTIIWMWDIDAEEAIRYDTTNVRFTPQAVSRPLPKKNPGGKGF